MVFRATPSGVILTEEDVTIIKGMLERGDRQHDIAAFFGVNGGRIAEILIGKKYSDSPVASFDKLPPPGPYLSGQQSRELQSRITMLEGQLREAKAELNKIHNITKPWFNL